MFDQSTSAPPQFSPIYIALIAAGAAITGTILQGYVFRVWERKRDKSAGLEVVYARYGEPLTTASSSLMWRLKEIFEQPVRAGFLTVDVCRPTNNKYATFANYKKLSTLYRLAILLGWVRACRRDFSSLKVADAKKALPVENAFSSIESALADGPQVEMERLRELAKIWNIELTQNDQQLSAIGIDIEAAIDSTMVSLGTSDLEQLPLQSQTQILEAVARALTEGLAIQPLDFGIISEQVNLAMKIVGIREAWIYRDWQSSIGDLVLRRVDRPDRTYDVIGFSEFENFCTCGDSDQRKWIARLSAVFDGVDIAKPDPYDHRYKQLKKLLSATASLTLALSCCMRDANVSKQTVDEAKRLAAQEISRS